MAYQTPSERVLGNLDLIERIVLFLPTNADVKRSAGVNKMFNAASKSTTLWKARAARRPTLTVENTNLNLPLLLHRTKKHMMKAQLDEDETYFDVHEYDHVEDGAALVDEYLKFMTVRRDTPLSTVFQPSPYIDEVWHAHILCTKDYHTFCKRVFGHYLHHNPGDGTGGFGYDNYENTLNAYSKRFGYEDLINEEVIWPEVGTMAQLLGDGSEDDGCG